VVGFLETVAVGGKFAMEARYDYDPNQELIALGISNAASAFMSGYPTTGSFSRTAVNAMLGATSLLSCALSAVVVLLAILFLLPVVALLPLACLAPIIIQGAIGVIDLHHFQVAFRANKAECFVMVVTTGVSLALTVKEGLLAGFCLSILNTMRELANPNLVVCGKMEDSTFRDIRNFPNAEQLPKVVVVRMDARLNFANARKMKEFCARAINVREKQGETIKYVVIDGKSINHVDLTGCDVLESLATSLNERDQKLIVANLKGPVSKCLASAGVPEALRSKGGYLCTNMDQALCIIAGEDPSGKLAWSKTLELVKRVDTANLAMPSLMPSNLYFCASDVKKPVTPEAPKLHCSASLDVV
jgi:SulP family sulfate permease